MCMGAGVWRVYASKFVCVCVCPRLRELCVCVCVCVCVCMVYARWCVSACTLVSTLARCVSQAGEAVSADTHTEGDTHTESDTHTEGVPEQHLWRDAHRRTKTRPLPERLGLCPEKGRVRRHALPLPLIPPPQSEPPAEAARLCLCLSLCPRLRLH